MNNSTDDDRAKNNASSSRSNKQHRSKKILRHSPMIFVLKSKLMMKMISQRDHSLDRRHFFVVYLYQLDLVAEVVEE